MQDRQNVVKDLVEREFRLWPFVGPVQMGVDIAVEVSPRDCRRNVMEDACRVDWVELGIHRHLLPDEEGGFKAQKYPSYPFILA
jgi:hypothetical protein